MRRWRKRSGSTSLPRCTRVRRSGPDETARSGSHRLISSVAGLVATPGNGTVYTATKWGLRGLGLSLRQELDGTGIGVSTVFPGPIRGAGTSARTGVACRGVPVRAPRRMSPAPWSGRSSGIGPKWSSRPAAYGSALRSAASRRYSSAESLAWRASLRYVRRCLPRRAEATGPSRRLTLEIEIG
jgi:NAD(P)-dependent dehydrogenase (short-subunit alcohol dehydrogenase family)